MKLLITHPDGKVTILPRLRGIAISGDRTLLMVLPGGSLVRKDADKWKNLQVLIDDSDALPIPTKES